MQCKICGVILVILLARSVHSFVPAGQEVNCNTALNVQPGTSNLTQLPNFIGPGSFWWGAKQSQSVAPVSWIDKCAKNLEACQAPSNETADASCVCNMWACLNPPPGPTAAQRPLCQWARPFLLQYYCEVAQNMSLTCPVPIPASCPSPPPADITFDDIQVPDTPENPQAVTIANGYAGLRWNRVQAALGYNRPATFYDGLATGMISPKVVATVRDSIEGGGIASFFALVAGTTFTLHSMYVTPKDPLPTDEPLIIRARDNNAQTVGEYTVQMGQDLNPLFIDFANPSTGNRTGTFEHIFRVQFIGRWYVIVLDNIDVTLDYVPPVEASSELAWQSDKAELINSPRAGRP